jgi:uncharacterized protein (DUF934 family)
MPLITLNGTVVNLEIPKVTEPESDGIQEALATDVVALSFEHANDGRSFSWAGLLRSEGFSGTLIGVGPIGLDRLACSFQVGFDAVQLSDHEYAELKEIHLRPFESSYQQDPHLTDHEVPSL